MPNGANDQPSNRRRKTDRFPNSWYEHKLIAVIIALVLGAYGYAYSVNRDATVSRQEIAQMVQQAVSELKESVKSVERKLDCVIDRRLCR